MPLRFYLPVSPWIILVIGVILILILEFSGILKSRQRRGIFGVLPWILVLGSLIYFIVYFGEEIRALVNKILGVLP
jgi:uncharacterized membrane protein